MNKVISPAGSQKYFEKAIFYWHSWLKSLKTGYVVTFVYLLVPGDG